MRKILLIIIVIPLAAAIAYGALWYQQAQRLKAGIEEAIASVNAQQKLLAYDSLDVGGFPLALTVDVTRPRFTARMDQLVQRLVPLIQAGGVNSQEEQLAATLSQLPEWHEGITWAGHVRFGVNLFSDRYTVSVDGPVTQISTMGNSAITLVSSPSGIHSCSLWLQREGQWLSGPWNIMRLSGNPVELAQDFRRLDCAIAPTTTTDDATKETVYSAGAGSISVSHAPQADGSRLFGFSVRADNQEAKPAFDNFINRYILMFAGVPGAPSTLDLAAYGKQQIALSLSLATPPNFGSMGSGGPFRLTLSELKLENALYTQNGTLDIDNRISGAVRDFTLLANFTTAFTPAYDQFLVDYLLKTIMQIKISSDPALAAVQNAFAPYTPEQVVSMLQPVIVRLSDFGQIVTHIDMRMQGDEQLRKGDLDIRRLEVSSAPYGVSMAGKAGMTGETQGITPESKLTLTCRNCAQLVSDTGAYAQRAEAVYRAFTPPTAGEKASPPVVTPQLVEGIQAFIAALATPQTDAAGAVLTVFELAGAAGTQGGLTVNGKPMEQVMQLYAQLVAPYLPGGPPAQPVVLQPMKQ